MERGLRNDTIPVGPIRRVMRAWISNRERDHYGLTEADADNLSKARSDLCLRVWPDRALETSLKRMYDILTIQDSISFDEADRILCRLGASTLWLFDDELRAAYEGMDFRGLDYTRPTSTSVAEANRRRVLKTYDRVGGQNATARELGCSVHYARRVLRGRQGLVGATA